MAGRGHPSGGTRHDASKEDTIDGVAAGYGRGYLPAGHAVRNHPGGAAGPGRIHGLRGDYRDYGGHRDAAWRRCRP